MGSQLRMLPAWCTWWWLQAPHHSCCAGSKQTRPHYRTALQPGNAGSTSSASCWEAVKRAQACIHGLHHLTPAAAALVCVTLQIKWCVINKGFPINKINQNGPVQFFLYAVSELHTNAC